MPDLDIDANCTRADFGYSVPVQTRWKDIDPYRHVNNTNYFTFFDTAIMHFLTVAGGFDLLDGPVVPFTVENMCRYHGSIVFPMVIDCALRVAHLGNSSVRYELGLFEVASPAPLATGYFIDVFVDSESQNPVPIPADLRAHLAGIAPADIR